MSNYILDGHTPVLEQNILTWAAWFEVFANRSVAYSILEDGEEVSTVFLGLDHNFTKGGPPLLFETLIRGGKHDGYMVRYPTWEQAEKGHNLIVQARLDGDTPILERSKN